MVVRNVVSAVVAGQTAAGVMPLPVRKHIEETTKLFIRQIGHVLIVTVRIHPASNRNDTS